MSEVPDVDILDVSDAFANADKSVVNWEGRNYYQACDVLVTGSPEEGGTFCVKRVDHPGDIHEDIDGNRKTINKGRYAIIVTLPFDPSPEGFAKVSEVMQTLKAELGDTDGRFVYNAVRGTADQIIMILDGEG